MHPGPFGGTHTVDNPPDPAPHGPQATKLPGNHFVPAKLLQFTAVPRSLGVSHLPPTPTGTTLDGSAMYPRPSALYSPPMPATLDASTICRLPFVFRQLVDHWTRRATAPHAPSPAAHGPRRTRDGACGPGIRGLPAAVLLNHEIALRLRRLRVFFFYSSSTYLTSIFVFQAAGTQEPWAECVP